MVARSDIARGVPKPHVPYVGSNWLAVAGTAPGLSRACVSGASSVYRQLRAGPSGQRPTRTPARIDETGPDAVDAGAREQPSIEQGARSAHPP